MLTDRANCSTLTNKRKQQTSKFSHSEWVLNGLKICKQPQSKKHDDKKITPKSESGPSKKSQKSMQLCAVGATYC